MLYCHVVVKGLILMVIVLPCQDVECIAARKCINKSSLTDQLPDTSPSVKQTGGGDFREKKNIDQSALGLHECNSFQINLSPLDWI